MRRRPRRARARPSRCRAHDEAPRPWRDPALPGCASASTATPSSATVGEHAARVDGVERRRRCTRRRAPRTRRRRRRPRSRASERPPRPCRRRRGSNTVALVPRSSQPSPRGVAITVVAAGSTAAARLRDRRRFRAPRPRRRARAARRPAPGRGQRPDDRDVLGDGGEERSGCERTAELLGEERELDRSEAEPAGGGRDGEGRPAELGHVCVQARRHRPCPRRCAPRRSRGRARSGTRR